MKKITLLKTLTIALFLIMGIGNAWGQVIISQYYEGASNDKWIEITNVGKTSVDLTNPQQYLCLFANAAADDPANNNPNNNESLSGTIAAGEVILFKNSSAALPNYASGTSSSVCNFNGDDLIIISTSNGASAWADRSDVIGNGTSWGENTSYYRNSNITSGNTTYSTLEWTEVTNSTVNNAASGNTEYLGTHVYSSGSSPTITLNTSSLIGFTYLFGTGPSAEQSFTVEGSDLSADIVITPPNNYEISETSGSNFTGDAITLTQSGGTVNSTTIYVRLEAGLTAGTYDEDITCSSTGATDKIVNLSGSVEVPNTTTLPYSEDFSSGFGDTYTYTVAGTKPWAIVTGGAQANGFSGENPEEHWLVMPGIDFNAYSDEVMTFTNFAKYGTIGANNYLKLFYSSDYPGIGNPTTYTWNELSFDQPAAGSVGSTEIETPSGIIDLSAISGNTVFLAFKYYSTDSPTSWRIDDILIYEDQSASEPTNHPTDFLATTNSSSEITLSWTDAVPAADGYLIKGSNVSYAAITNPKNGTPETDGALVQNVAAGVETHQFTGLNAETTYYFKIFPYNGLETTINYKTDGAPQDDATTDEAPATPITWINEIHYDNVSGDVDELIEIVIKNPGNYDLSKFLVNLYNGNGGASYDTETADNMTEGNTIGTYTFFTWSSFASGIQNGGPDGMALSYDGTLIQFLSYEGTFTATDGPANGIESTDIGVSETGTTPVGHSLQLSGTGTVYTDFTWQEPATATPGALNNNQFLLYETVWTGASTTDWNTSANWSNGVPTSSANTTIGNAETVVISSSTEANCYNLTLNGSLTIKSDATGTGSLLINGIVDGTGSTSIERYVTGGQNEGTGTSLYKYHLISIPLASDIQAGDVFTGSYLWHFVPNQTNEDSWLGITSLTENLDNQKGFLSYVADESDKFIFTGTMNNGDFTVAAESIEAENVKLIPNPYPSAIDWETVDLTGTGLNPTIWLFNSNTGNYESYNDGAGLGQQYIPVGQAVFVEAASADPSLTFTNAHRTHNQGNGFYKSGDELAKDLLKIAVSANNSSDATFIRFREQANNAYNGFDDATKLKGFSGAPQLFTHATDGKALSINTLATSQETVIVPLSFELDASGEAVLSFEYLETFEPEVEIYLEDLLTDQMINIRETGYYTFSHEVENDPLRFNLHFMGVTAVQDLRASENHFKVWTNENQLYILPTDKLTEGSLQIGLFDLSGRLIQSVDKQVQKPVILSLPDYDGIMLVRIQNEKLVQTQKIFIR
jgi:hypothetical protein